jgi:hypothetical protein
MKEKSIYILFKKIQNKQIKRIGYAILGSNRSYCIVCFNDGLFDLLRLLINLEIPF